MRTTESKLLLIAPLEAQARALCDFLSEDGGAGVRTLAHYLDDAESVQDADLVLLDLRSGEAEGLASIAALRRQYHASELPILLLAGDLNPEAALAAGANDYVPGDPLSRDLRLRMAGLLLLKKQHSELEQTKKQYRRETDHRIAKLDMLIDNGLMMSIERDKLKLLRHILTQGQKLLNCDGATMYLVTENKTLRFAIRTKDDELPSFEIPLYDPATGTPNEKYVSTYVALNNRTVVINDVYREMRFDLSGTRRFDEASHYRTVSMLTVPMAPRGADVIGVLQFFNALDGETGAITHFPDDILPLIEALAAQAAVALDNLQLIEEQRELIESMIEVIATAIDAKSSYTGKHCSRVPELAIMLADAANKTESGPLADFRFNNADEWREFQIGAWLHDCGKVSTPEYVVDKATKLETIYNRIHEVRTRFEVLYRDAEIARLQSLLTGDSNEAADASFNQQIAMLHEDFSFVAACNIGAESMSMEDVQRLRRIAEKQWLRHFDDRLGISHIEAALFPQAPSPALPVLESLLADKSWHIVPRDAADIPDPKFRFKMDVPTHLYNRGELYNLSVRYGTLTAEERYKINEHMVYTIKMLECMKFPKSLRRVPEYAGAHHEKLDGQGYPRRLNAEQISIPGRILAIADVFEALTASDRPYKQAKKVSEALSIMSKFCANSHLDPELFKLFLTSGVLGKYAETFLAPEQIDEVDISKYVN